MKRLLLILIIGMYSLACYSQEIISTKNGGDWNNPKTWLNGKIPDINSNVVISGKVIVKNPIECKNLRISKKGNLDFSQTQDSLTAKVSEILKIVHGKIIIGEKWKIFAKEIIKTNPAKIENYGIIEVGM
jgi:hypothetical protein